MKHRLNIFWFRRDLRLDDNAGLYHALKSDRPVLPVFIFDRNILDQLEDKKDARVEFIYTRIEQLQNKLAPLNSCVRIFYGRPLDVFQKLVEEFDIGVVFANEDYEPYARSRDTAVESFLNAKGAGFQLFKDQVLLSRDEVLKVDDLPYTVFTPYSNKWKEVLKDRSDYYLKSYPSEKYLTNLDPQKSLPYPDLVAMGFSDSGRRFPSASPDPDLIKKYTAQRDFPGLDATSHLGVHLRFGTISIRRLAREAIELSSVFLNELIWREFYQMILWHFPKLGQGKSFKEAYDRILWRNNEKEFEAWCTGKTGYPLVDAGMRQLNTSGFMHNRVRMVTASFLAKHLLIDWRWGEAYFASRLLDFDLASNNGGWQWAAGSGCDAAPYFRIFNPTLQLKKFDPDGEYIRKWLPDFQELNYPAPIVEHRFARERALRVYGQAVKEV